jgi:nucleoside-diphosphate-sugar epimerase
MSKPIRVSVIGCGWLGWPLAKTLAKNGYDVLGTTTRPSQQEKLQEENSTVKVVVFDALQIANDDEITSQIFSSDVVIVCIPPSRQQPDSYAKALQNILDCCVKYGASHVMFTSSTSVYPDLPQTFDETFDVQQNGGSAHIVAAEKTVLLYSERLKINILRLGGLISADRNPARYLSAERMPNGNTPVNFVHRHDCIGVILHLLQRDIFGKTYNVVATEHPTRKEFYAVACEKLGISCPPFPENQPEFNRVISNELLRQETDYKFVFSSPLQMFSE